MAKTLLEWEGKLIDTYGIKRIEKTVAWNYKESVNFFCIEFNKGFLESAHSPTHDKFEYNTEKQRDEKWELLKLQLTDLEFIEIV